MGEAQQLAHPKTAYHKVSRPFQLCYGNLMGLFTPVAISVYKYVSKGGDFTGEEVWQYCLGTGIIQEFAAANTRKQIGVSECVERTLCTMVRCMPADSGFPLMWGELFMAAASLKNRIRHNVLKRETLLKMLHREKADLSYLRVIGAGTFVRIKDSRKLDAAAWERKVCGYSEENKSYRVWNPKTHRVVESRNVTFIETLPHLVPRLQSSLRCKSWYCRRGISTTTIWTTTTFHTTTYCGMEETTPVFWTSPPTFPLTTRTPVACLTMRKCRS